LWRRSRRHLSALVDEVGEVRDAQRVADVVVGDDDSDAAFSQRADLDLQVGDRDRVDAEERLVEKDVARPTWRSWGKR